MLCYIDPSYGGLLASIAVFGILLCIIGVLLVVACYIVCALGFMKALKRVGYPNAWLAWIPLAQYYALADVAAQGQENITIIGTLSIPAMLYKLWWVVAIVINIVPAIGSILALAITIICSGHVFTRLFAMIERTSEQSQQAIGYISGFIPLVGAIKFLVTK
jgi:hypothetical protein